MTPARHSSALDARKTPCGVNGHGPCGPPFGLVLCRIGLSLAASAVAASLPLRGSRHPGGEP